MILDEDGWQRADSPVGTASDGPLVIPRYCAVIREPRLFNFGGGRFRELPAGLGAHSAWISETVACDVPASTARRERILM
jgi:hypothetical protein